MKTKSIALLFGLTGLLAFGLPISTALAVSDNDSLRLYELIDNGKLKAATNETSDLLSDHPGDPVLLFVQALIADKSGNPEKAVSLYQQLTVSHPTLLEPYNNLAIQQASQGDLKAAIATLERAMQANPAVATAYRNLTAIYAQMASVAYRKALNSTTPLAPLKLATIEKIQSPEAAALRRPTLVTSVENFVNESLADNALAESSDNQAVTDAQTKPALQPVEVAIAPSAPEPAPAKEVVVPEPAAETVAEPNSSPTSTPEPESKPELKPEPSPRSSVAEVKVATAKPSDEARRAAEQVAEDKQKIINHIKSWASAWSDRDVDRYLGHYSSQFKPRNDLSLDEWKKQRYGRLRWREFIVVKPSKYNIDLDKDEATVNFNQYYKSERFEDTIRKTLKLKKEGTQWRIVRELI